MSSTFDGDEYHHLGEVTNSFESTAVSFFIESHG